MKTLNKYILKQLLVGFLLIALGMTGIIWLSQSLRMIDWIVNKGVSVNLFVQLTLLVLPNFIAIITPLAFFIVLLFVYQRLLADRELVVMKAVGMSPWQLAKPGLYMSLILVALGYCLTLWLVPYSVTHFKELRFKIRNDLAHVVIQEGEFNDLPNNVTIYVRSFKPTGELAGILIHDGRDPEKRIVMVAQNGLYVMGEEPRIVMHQGRRQEYNRRTGIFSSLSFDHNTMVLEENRQSKERSAGEEELPLLRLLTVRSTDPGITPGRFREYKVEAFKRLTQPLYSLVYLMMGLLPLLLGYYNRRGQNGRIYMAIFAVILIQSLALGFENLSEKNLLFLILMALNILLPLTVGLFILRRGYFIKERPSVRQHRQKVLLLLVACLLMSVPAQAAEPQFIADTTIQKDAPAPFEADAVSYNEKTGVVTATGNVVIEQAGSTVRADKIEYDPNLDTVHATGNVVLTRPDGVQLFSEEAELTGDIKEGMIKAVHMKLADGSTFEARSVLRADSGNITDFKSVFFTPCTYCAPEKPLWSIRAGEVIHNYREQEFIYKHAYLNLKGVPVFYWPYLEYPDFQVKRKTGFLTPALASSTEMGSGFELPFFWAISDSQDLYINPTISFSHVPLVQGRYRGLYQQSGLTFDFSGTQNDDDHNNEGHIKAHYEYDITDRLRFRGTYFRVSDDTYFRRYPIDNVDDQAPWIQSDAALEHFGEESYAYVRMYAFQNLRADVDNGSMPKVPQINYEYVTKPLWNGLYSISQINGAGVYRHEKPESTRLSYLQALKLPYISSIGAVINTEASVRFDGYTVQNVEDETKNTGRVYPNVAVEVRYPLMQQGQNYSQVLEPIVMGVWSPNSSINKNIPDEDSLDYEFDDTNLFSANRYAGYDRVETGTRLNYGMQWTLYGPGNMSVSAFFGQSYRFRDDNSMIEGAGFENHFSSYVGHLNMNLKDFGMNYRFRLDQDNFSQEMSEVSFYAGRDPFRITVGYFYMQASQENKINNFLKDREEIYGQINSRLTRSWSAYGYYRYDLAADGGPIEAGGGLQFENECIILLFSAEKEFTKDRDYKGDTSFYARMVLKTLGAV